MARRTPYLNLYVVERGEKIPINETFVKNMEKVDEAFQGLNGRMASAETAIVDLKTNGVSGEGNVVVSDDEPENPDNKIWFDII